MLTDGAVIAGYRVIRVLGVGGMGAVYLAANPTLPRQDALKMLSAELSRDPEFRTRFMREADVAASLDHPNIVSVYNRGRSEEGQLWIAMQYVDGTDAEAALRAGTMTPERAVHVITGVAKALDHAHSHHVVHRDVKPANFLLSGPPGPDERVLLGDFGIARALGDIGLTVTGSVLATVAYAAPEVLASRPFDARADIYSLGCTLFRLLTGKTPFPGTNGMAAVMMAHLQQPPPRVTDLVPALPPALDAVIAIAMAKNPADRFPSASALARAAASALNDPRTTAPTSLPPVRTGDVNTYPRQQGWWQDRPPNSHTVQAPPSPPRRRRRTVVVGALAAVGVLVAATVAVIAWPRNGTAPENSGSTNAGTPRSSVAQGPPATDVGAAELRAILLPAKDVPADTTGGPLVLATESTDLVDGDGMSTAECVSAWFPASRAMFDGKGWSAAAVQELRGLSRRSWEDSVVQAVVAFEPAQDAGLFMVDQRQTWEVCGGQRFTLVTPEGTSQGWTLGQPATVAGVLTLAATLDGGDATCQRGIVVRGNVFIDVRQCRSGEAPDVSALVTAIANRMPKR